MYINNPSDLFLPDPQATLVSLFSLPTVPHSEGTLLCTHLLAVPPLAVVPSSPPLQILPPHPLTKSSSPASAVKPFLIDPCSFGASRLAEAIKDTQAQTTHIHTNYTQNLQTHTPACMCTHLHIHTHMHTHLEQIVGSEAHTEELGFWGFMPSQRF